MQWQKKPYRYNTKLTIYQCDVEDFVRYDELYLSGKVYDACLTQECWYLKPLVMDGKYVFLKEFACDCQFVPLEHKKGTHHPHSFSFRRISDRYPIWHHFIRTSYHVWPYVPDSSILFYFVWFRPRRCVWKHRASFPTYYVSLKIFWQGFFVNQKEIV